MEIRIERYTSNARSTLSLVFLDGVFQCFGLEDEHRVVKVMGETRIPAGTYRVDLRTAGGMIKRYQARYGGASRHPGMLWLRDVPNFKWVYIHVGNTEKHTAGCILVGRDVRRAPKGWSIPNSATAYLDLYDKVMPVAASGDLVVTIVDRDLATLPRPLVA